MSDLILYYSPTCGYCHRVLAVGRKLGIELELRDARADPEHGRTLREAMGRSTVPVLRYRDEEGGDRWMPESGDIIRFLRDRAGVVSRWPPWVERIASQSMLLGAATMFVGAAVAPDHVLFAVVGGALVAVAGWAVRVTA